MIARISATGLRHEIGDGGGRRAIIDCFNHDFEAGKFYCVTGPSGSGKTSLLSILSTIVRPLDGQLNWNSEGNLLAQDDRVLARWRKANVGFVFQTYRLVDVLTVQQHVVMLASLRTGSSVREEGLRILDGLGLRDRLDQYPQELSGGEKQRLALCMAIAFRPTVLLADEPTASLDSVNAAAVASTLGEYARLNGSIVIAVSHDSAMIDAADEQIVLRK